MIDVRLAGLSCGSAMLSHCPYQLGRLVHDQGLLNPFSQAYQPFLASAPDSGEDRQCEEFDTCMENLYTTLRSLSARETDYNVS